MLNPASPLPLYQQLADVLAESIRTGVYSLGGRIPSENELAEQYKIGRPTVRQALEVLNRKNLLVKRRGSGTFVREKAEEVDLFSLAGTSAAFHSAGIAVKREIIQKPRFIESTKGDGNPFAGMRTFFFSRLNRAEGAPVLLEDIYLDAGLFPGIDKMNLEEESLSSVIRDRFYGVPSGGRQVFEISSASGEKAAFLGLEAGTPVLLVRRTIHLKHKENAIYIEMLCRTDRYAFSQNLSGG